MRIVSDKKLDKDDIDQISSLLQSIGLRLYQFDDIDTDKAQSAIKSLSNDDKASVRDGCMKLGLRPCWRCQRILDKSAFNKNRSAHDGLATYCRACYKKELSKYKDNPSVEQIEEIGSPAGGLDVVSLYHTPTFVCDHCKDSGVVTTVADSDGDKIMIAKVCECVTNQSDLMNSIYGKENVERLFTILAFYVSSLVGVIDMADAYEKNGTDFALNQLLNYISSCSTLLERGTYDLDQLATEDCDEG